MHRLGSALLAAALVAGGVAWAAQRVTGRPWEADGLFIGPPAGTTLVAERHHTDLDRLAHFIGDAEEAAYRSHGFRALEERTFDGPRSGGTIVTLVEAADPAGIVTDLAATGELGEPLADLPSGHQRITSAELGDGAVNHTRIATFVQGGWVVTVTSWGYTPTHARERLDAAVAEQRAVLAPFS